MFGSVAGESVVHDETSALNPQSPYAAAKAAAHLLCGSYRESYGIRIACGILFNHESRRRGRQFLSRKVVDHVHALRAGLASGPLALGNLKAAARLGLRARLRRRDGRDPAPGGRARRARRGGAATATTCSARAGCMRVWELADRAFALAGFDLAWSLDGDDPLAWTASFADSGRAGGRRRPGLHPARRPEGDRREPEPRSSPSSAGSRGPGSISSSRTCSTPHQAPPPLSRAGTAARRAPPPRAARSSATRAGRGSARARSRSRSPSRRWSSACRSP